VVERETKTKAYSKEGLTSANKLDPAEKERMEISQWLNQCLDTLNIQIDQFEAEIETLGASAGGKKKKGGKHSQANSENADAIEEFQGHLTRHRDHVQKLETLLRMLDNDNVNIEQVSPIATTSRPYAGPPYRSKTSRTMSSIISRVVRSRTSPRTRQCTMILKDWRKCY